MTESRAQAFGHQRPVLGPGSRKGASSDCPTSLICLPLLDFMHSFGLDWVFVIVLFYFHEPWCCERNRGYACSANTHNQVSVQLLSMRIARVMDWGNGSMGAVLTVQA